MSLYFDELTRTMSWLSENEKVKFVGQSVKWDGHALFKTMKDVPEHKRLELPVFEDFQLGLSIGLAYEGWVPISIYPRSDFLILASNHIANHLANVRIVNDNKLKCKVIIRVSVGSTRPIHPGIQHCQDHTEAIKLLTRNEINVVKLESAEQIFPEYKNALERQDNISTILVEYGNLYN